MRAFPDLAFLAVSGALLVAGLTVPKQEAPSTPRHQDRAIPKAGAGAKGRRSQPGRAEPGRAGKGLMQTRAREKQPFTGRRIALPPALSELRFGDSPEQVSGLHPIAWERTNANGRMLVYYPGAGKRVAVRCLFRHGELRRIEIDTRPPDGMSVHELYRNLQQTYCDRYGDLPGSRQNRWTDGVIVVGMETVTGKARVHFAAR